MEILLETVFIDKQIVQDCDTDCEKCDDCGCDYNCYDCEECDDCGCDYDENCSGDGMICQRD